MFSLPAARRSAVERLVFASLILGGGLLWGRVIEQAATGPSPLPTTVCTDGIRPPGDVARDIDWQPLIRDLATLAPVGDVANVTETAPGGR